MKPLANIGAILVLTSMLACATFHRGPLPGEPQASYLQLGDTRVHYEDTGETDRPVVVLIHGFASSLRVWDSVQPTLHATHRVISLDLRGFGWTDRPPGDYSPSGQADLVLALLDQLGVERAALVAHSWGSSVALAAAMRAPHRVTRLALYSAWVYEEQLPTFFVWSRAAGMGEMLFSLYYKERIEDRMALAFFDTRHVTAEEVERVTDVLERPGTVAAALAAARGQRFAEMQRRYGGVEQPVLLLWGREDRVSQLAMGERLAKELPGATLRAYPQCGHFPMVEALDASTRDLVEFLEREGGA